jgi:hypothetical protein
MTMTAPRSPVRGHLPEGVGFAGAAGALVAMLMLSGCPGTLDAKEFGTGGNPGSGGTGGGNPTGGAPGTGGTALDCTGGNEGTAILTNSCALSGGCHIPGSANDGRAGGLDLTPDANIASRLVDVMSVGTADNGSMCMGNPEPYLRGGISPAQGLLIDKLKPSRPCGAQMPADSAFFLTPTQQSCLTQWATTLTSP